MTVEVHGSGTSNPWGDFGNVGLEDVGAGDMTMPRLQIVHEKGVFKDSSTNQEIDELECIVLGLVKQRIMWDSEVDDGDKPQCKSPDFKLGYPQMRDDIPTRKQFPWSKSNFDKADYPPNEDGQIILPCDSCKFSKWGADREKPPCSEQATYPVLYRSADGDLRPAIISFQRSSIKAARNYAGTFRQTGQPMFTVWTRISLTMDSRGKVVYSTASFKRLGPSEQEEWKGYVESFYSARDWLQQAPRPATKEADEEEASKKGNRPTPASAATATALPDDDPWATASPAAASTAPSSPMASDDLPF